MKSAESTIRYQHYIDGAHVAPSSGQFLPTENPYTGKVWAEIARGDRADAEAAVSAAQRAFESGAWPALTASERGRMLWRLGDLVIANAPRLADIEQRDNGKLASEVVSQVRYMGTTSATTRGSPTRSRAPSSRPTRRACSHTRATSPRASSRSSRRGIRR
jgi:aldehyde dehydrogenase (NAD+)